MNLLGFFGEAARLYRRNVGYLLVAGIIAGAISTAVIYISMAIVGAGGAEAFGAAGGRRLALTGMLGGAAAGLAIGVFVAAFLTVVLEGGLMKMTIDSGRSGRAAQLGDLLAGFRYVPSYLGLGLITVLGVPLGWQFAIVVAARMLSPASLLLFPVGVFFMVWLYVSWVYAVPLIADRGLGPIAALVRSRGMVSRVGWWTTFRLLGLLGTPWSWSWPRPSFAAHAGSADRAPGSSCSCCFCPSSSATWPACTLNSESTLGVPPITRRPDRTSGSTVGGRPATRRPPRPRASTERR